MAEPRPGRTYPITANPLTVAAPAASSTAIGRSDRIRLAIFGVLLSLFVSTSVNAQVLIPIPIGPNSQDEPTLHKEFDGTWVRDLPNPNANQGPMTPAGSMSFMGMSSAITINYEDVTTNADFGFDDSTIYSGGQTIGELRRETLDSVVTMIESYVHAPGDLSIDVQLSTNLPGSGTLASAAPRMQAGTGYQKGPPFRHLVEGIDYNTGTGDMVVTVNFGRTWESDENATVGGSEFDLYSVLLHELTHGLGIMSTTDANGDGPVENVNTRSLFDSYLYFSTTQLFPSDGSFAGTTANLTRTSVRFQGSYATAEYGSYPWIYSPSPFNDGSSIGHWNGSVHFTAVMQHSIGTGVTRRELLSFEQEALNDLGYNVTTAVPTAADDYISVANSETIRFYFSANDSLHYPDQSSRGFIVNPTHGTMTQSAWTNGTEYAFEYNNDGLGTSTTDSMTYEVCDYNFPSLCARATVYFTICIDSLTCTGNGSCQSDETCQCDTGYSGSSCDSCDSNYFDYPNCSFCTAEASCNNNGTCDTSDGSCDCSTGFDGSDCSSCDSNYFGYPSCTYCTSAATCNSHGSCETGDGSCDCSTGFADPDCGTCDTDY